MKIYKTSEAADALNVSAWFVRKECKAGRMPHHRNGERMVFFTQDDIDLYLKRTARSQSPASEGGAA